MTDSKRNRKAVIAAARRVAERHTAIVKGGHSGDCDVCGLADTLRMLDSSQRVTEFMAKIRKRGIRLCEVGDCVLRADHGIHEDGSGHAPGAKNRCTYVEDGMRCVLYGGDEWGKYHADHLLEDREGKV